MPRLTAGTAAIRGDALGTLYIEGSGERAEIDADVRYVTTRRSAWPVSSDTHQKLIGYNSVTEEVGGAVSVW